MSSRNIYAPPPKHLINQAYTAEQGCYFTIMLSVFLYDGVWMIIE